MHATAIVPECRVIVRPAEADLKFQLLAMIAKHVEDYTALFGRQLVDPGRKRPVYVQCFSICVRVGAHHGVHGGRAGNFFIVPTPIGISAEIHVLGLVCRRQSLEHILHWR